MESNPKRPYKKDSLSCVNSFITRVNKKLVNCSQKTTKIACALIAAILDKNKKQVQKLAEDGIPDDLPILRAYIWKILLNYLPEDPKKWEETLINKRKEYNNYKIFIETRMEKELKEKDYKSRATLEQIIKDVYRTGTQISFFYEPTNKNTNQNKEEYIKKLERRKNCTFTNIDEIYYNEKEFETHVDVLKRILFIYTYFCPDISYHQGMNELLAPIYYCYSYDKTYTEENEEDIEADSYWSFYNLMSKVSQSFVSANDKGLEIKSFIFQKCLEYVDIDIYKNLQQLNIRNEYYCYKWFILLFSQEFEINELLKIWDLIFSHEDKYYYVVYLGLAIMKLKKDTMVSGEMVDILQSLQNYQDLDVVGLILKAKELNKENKEELDDFILRTKKIIEEDKKGDKNAEKKAEKK